MMIQPLDILRIEMALQPRRHRRWILVGVGCGLVALAMLIWWVVSV